MTIMSDRTTTTTTFPFYSYDLVPIFGVSFLKPGIKKGNFQLIIHCMHGYLLIRDLLILSFERGYILLYRTLPNPSTQ